MKRSTCRAASMRSSVLGRMNIEALIGRLQDHALADAPGTMTDEQVDVAIALLDRVLPDLHRIELHSDGDRPDLGSH